MKYHLKYPTIRILVLSSLLIFVLLLLFVWPALAQDATPAPHAASTQEATLEAAPIATADVAPVAIDVGSGGNVTINTGAAPTTPTTPAIPPETSTSPVVYAAFIVIGLMFIGVLYNQTVIVKTLGPLMPPEAVNGLIAAVMPTLTDLIMNTVATRIPTDLDDRAFIEAARQRGYTVTKDELGVYHTTPSPIPEVSRMTMPQAVDRNFTPPNVTKS